MLYRSDRPVEHFDPMIFYKLISGHELYFIFKFFCADKEKFLEKFDF